MHKRLNITLPEETVNLIDRVSAKGDRSRFIDEAVQRYVREVGRARLRSRLKEGALRRAERDRQLAEEYFLLDDSAWRAR
jgi:CopG family transcriptional regulator/antitoxin EndoAI